MKPLLFALCLPLTAFASWNDPTGTLACRTWRDGPPWARHGFLCENRGTGALSGAVVGRQGWVRCIFSGTDDGRCLTIVGCRLDQRVCNQ